MVGNTEKIKCCLALRAARGLLGVRVNLLEWVNGCVFFISILNSVFSCFGFVHGHRE